MSITRFCQRYGFIHYGTPSNSWDSFHPSGTVLMQLWQAPGQRVRNHALPRAYLRVRCFDSAHYESGKTDQRIGYNGRLKSIAALEKGAVGYVLMSTPPTDEHGAGAWSKYANLESIYPVLAIERDAGGDIFVILAPPAPPQELERLKKPAGQSTEC